MIVMKFGGTSLADADRIKNVFEIIRGRLEKKPIVVVSAVSGVTDLLIKTAKESVKGINPNEKAEEIINIHKRIINELNLEDDFLIDDFTTLYDALNGVYLLKELSPRSIDFISSFGEIFSSKIVAEYLNSQKISSRQYSGWDAGILTNDEFTNSEVLDETYDMIKSNLGTFDKIPIVTGFIAKNKDGEITTLAPMQAIAHAGQSGDCVAIQSGGVDHSAALQPLAIRQAQRGDVLHACVGLGVHAHRRTPQCAGAGDRARRA